VNAEDRMKCGEMCDKLRIIHKKAQASVEYCVDDFFQTADPTQVFDEPINRARTGTETPLSEVSMGGDERTAESIARNPSPRSSTAPIRNTYSSRSLIQSAVMTDGYTPSHRPDTLNGRDANRAYQTSRLRRTKTQRFLDALHTIFCCGCLEDELVSK
jgi:hypothetical protein